MRGRAWRAAAAAGLVLLPGGARAQQTAGPSEVVVTGSHFSRFAGQPTADLTVLPAAAAAPGATLSDLLGQAADVEVQQPGGAAGVASVFLRGADPNFSQVMVEGAPLNDPTNSRGGSVDVSALNALEFERAEVVRGALSAVYGSGALAGAINLVLPSGTSAPSAALQASGGTDRSLGGHALAAGPLGGGAGGALGFGYQDAGHDVPQSSRRNTAVSAKLSPLDGSEAYELFVRLSKSDARAFPDDSGGPRLAVIRATETTRARDALVGGHWRRPVASRITLELNGSALWRTLDDLSPGVAPAPGDPLVVPAGASRDGYSSLRGQAIVRAKVWKGWRALAGAEALREHGRDDSRLTLFGRPFPGRFDLERTTLSAFGETDLARGPLSFDGALRLDRPQGLGAHLSAHVGAAVKLGGGWSARAAWGEAFKAPSFYALGNAFVGNPALLPETSASAEVALAWRGDRGRYLEAVVFRTRFHDLIDFVPTPVPRLVNRGSVASDGVEARTGADLGSRAAVQLSAAYADTRDRSDGARLLSRPAWRATGTVSLTLSRRLHLRIDGRYIGDRLDSSIPTGPVVLPAYATADLRLQASLPGAMELEAAVLNALDRRYEAAVGFPSPGRVGRLSLATRF